MIRFAGPLAFCFILVGAAGAWADYAAEVSHDAPVAWWRFADKSTAEGAAAKDATGQHASTYHGNTTIEDGVPGIGGKAVRFDGRTAFVEVPNHQDFALGTLSVECWFRSTQDWTEPNWPASATLVSKATDGAGSGDWVLLGGAADGQNGVAMSRPGPLSGADYPLASPIAVNDGAWHHLVWTRAATGANRLYLDGALAASGQDSGGAIRNDRPIQIGGDPLLKGKYFAGQIAEVAIYSTALDETRIVAHLKAAGMQPRTSPRPPAPQKTAPIAQQPSASPATVPAQSPKPLVLKADAFRHYVDQFNQDDNELYAGHFPNSAAWNFLSDNIPLLDCPDEDIQTTYYFRWWTYRKHIKETPAGFVVDEFLPNVGWAGKYNTIDCAAGHHLYEGRWLGNPQFLDDYSRFWFRGGGEPRRYSFWAADSIWARCCVTGNAALAVELLPDLIANYQAWEAVHRDANGLYWQIDDRDGMEGSIGGSGYRATINSYQFGDALAIANIAEVAGKPDIARDYREKAAAIKALVQDQLWDAGTQFFKVRPRGESKPLADVRELHGFAPWYFNLPDPQYAVAWKQATDPQGFLAPFGLTTAEQRSVQFAVTYAGHECQWNGPVWPFATSIALTGLANLLNGPPQDAIHAKDYFELLKSYAKSQRLKLADGRVVPWIDEDQNPTNGDWIARTLLVQRKQQPTERGKDYNHSTFCDLVISGLVGLRPRTDDTIDLNPLVPPSWDYFCLDQIPYHGRWLTILFDKTGSHYGKGAGLRVFADGNEIAASDKIGRIQAKLSPAATLVKSGGWKKFAGNPVMGGKYGTCFDISVLREDEKYRMWLSWRPKQSVALVESSDGIHWSEPPQIVLGPRQETGWEDDINRPVVVRRDDGYHLWYTGQAKGHSWIGYATSADGVTWKRQSDKPVLSADQRWEKVAVMCPHVLWDAESNQFRMWYSGGDQHEPNAIGYATSPDGLTWTKSQANPIFLPDPNCAWEKHKVTACQVEKRGGWHLMFYIGFRDEQHAQIGIARSRDGITGWQRHAANPIVRPDENQWDHDACYKPYAIFDGTKWLLWYNGRHGGLEQIGVAFHEGEDLGFD
jgi:predicted GH43/DUF377 family glycosyl hydrolase